MHGSILTRVPILDARYYYEWARKIMAGDWRGGADVYAMSPGYSYLLAIIFKVFGTNLVVVTTIQCFVSAASCAIVYCIARRTFSIASCITASLLLAGYGASVFYANVLLKASWIEFFNAACLLTIYVALEESSFWMWLLPGTLLGASAQFRPNIFLFLPLIVIYIWMRANIGIKRLPAIGAVFLGVGLTLGPVVIRNRIVGGEWALSTAHGGMNFYTGNNSQSAVPYRPLPFARSDPQYEQDDFLLEAARRTGKKLSRAQASEFWYHEAYRTISSDFSAWISLLAKKALFLWSNYEQPINQNLYFYREKFSLLKPLTIIGYWLIAPLGIFGVFLSLRDRALLPLHLYLLANAIGLILFFVVSEYRHPITFVLVIYAACSLDWFRAQIALGNNSWRRIAIALATLLILCFGTVVPAKEESEWKHQDLAVAYGNLGCAYMTTGSWDKAIEALSTSAAIAPTNADTQYNLGESYMSMNRAEEAKLHLLEAMRLRPNFLPQHFRPLLAHAYTDLGDWGDAKRELMKTLDSYPSDADAINNLALVYKQAGQIREAAATIERLLSIEPPPREGLLAATQIAASLGNKPQVVKLLSKLASISPNDPAVLNNLGIALADEGQYREAKIQFEQVLKLAPGYNPAATNLDRVNRILLQQRKIP